MKCRRIPIYAAVVLTLVWGVATADPMISVGTYIPPPPYAPLTTFVVPIDIAGAVALTSWQFDLLYDAADVQVNVGCDPFSDQYCGLLTGPITEGPFFGSLSPFDAFNPGFILLDGVTLAQLGKLIAVNDTFGGSLPGPSGAGVLAYVEFITTENGTGESPITVQNGSTISSVPEPATFALLSCGLLMLGVRRAAQPQRALSVAAAATAMALFGCGEAPQEKQSNTGSPHSHLQQSNEASVSRSHGVSAWQETREQQTDILLARYAAARDDADPSARMQVIEGWAQHARPDSSLDLLTNALVDPDEAVRMRAQELLEQELDVDAARVAGAAGRANVHEND